MKRVTFLILLWLSASLLFGCALSKERTDEQPPNEAELSYGADKESNLIEAENDMISAANEASEAAFTERLAAFARAAEQFDHMVHLSGHEINDIFSNCTLQLQYLLQMPSSTAITAQELNQYLKEENGFMVKTSAVYKIEGTYYRFVELDNLHFEQSMGALRALQLQYWNDTSANSVIIGEIATTATTAGLFFDYYIVQEQKIAVAIKKLFNNAEGDVEYYHISIFHLNEGTITNYMPLFEDDISNKFWSVYAFTDTIYLPEKEGILSINISEQLKENDDYFFQEDNIDDTSLIIIDGTKFSVFITSQPEKSISFELIDGMITRN
jgi:hypothetical protein